jgi:hypothetical protein
MINIDAFIMGTCQQDRLVWLDKSVGFLDSQHFPFTNKYLILDQFDGHVLNQDLEERFKLAGWTVLKYSIGGGRDGTGRAQCMIRALEQVASDVIFYNEDDILVRMPDFNDIQKLLTTTINTRECGMISLNIGGSDHDFPNKKFGDLDNIKDRVVLNNSKYLSFIRDEARASRWFVEFPGLFIQKSLLSNILKPSFGNGGIEIHLTEEYFRQQMHERYFKCSVCKTNIYSVIDFYRNNFNLEMFETAKLIRLLDSNQGDVNFLLDNIPMV